MVKTKELKDELKVDILTVDNKIDRYVQNIGSLIDNIEGNYEAKVKFLTE